MNKPLFLMFLIILLDTSFCFNVSAEQVNEFHRKSVTHEEFYNIVDQISKEKLEVISRLIESEKQMTELERARKIVLNKMKLILPFSHLKEMIITQGLPVVTITLAGELVTTWILPTVFTILQLPLLAIVSAIIPSPAYLLPTYFYFIQQKEKKKMANFLGVSVKEIENLNRLKKAILQFITENRVLSILYTKIENDPEFSIIKRSFLQRMKTKSLPPGQIDLTKLEKIVKTYYSKRTLDIIRESSKTNDTIYATVIISYIKEHPQALKEFEKYLEQIANEILESEE